MRKLVSIALISVLVLGIFQILAPRASAQGAAPSWSNGDWWEYTGSGSMMGYTFTATMKQTVVDRQQVSVGGISYETYHCTMTMSLTMSGTTVTMNGDSYTRTSDGADVKAVMSMNIGTTTTITVTLDPPAGGLAFPLTNGKTWSDNTTETTMTNPGGTTSRMVHYNYTASGPQKMTVPAGTFDAYAIEMREQTPPYNTTTIYYSDTVGNMLRMTTPLLGAGTQLSMELKSYFYAAKAFLGGLWWVLVIIVVVVVVVATVAIMIRRRRKAKLAPPLQPAGSVYGQLPMQQQSNQQPYQPPYQPPQPPPPQP